MKEGSGVLRSLPEGLKGVIFNRERGNRLTSFGGRFDHKGLFWQYMNLVTWL